MVLPGKAPFATDFLATAGCYVLEQPTCPSGNRAVTKIPRCLIADSLHVGETAPNVTSSQSTHSDIRNLPRPRRTTHQPWMQEGAQGFERRSNTQMTTMISRTRKWTKKVRVYEQAFGSLRSFVLQDSSNGDHPGRMSCLTIPDTLRHI